MVKSHVTVHKGMRADDVRNVPVDTKGTHSHLGIPVDQVGILRPVKLPVKKSKLPYFTQHPVK